MEWLLSWIKMPFVPRYTVTIALRTGTVMTLKFTKFDYKYSGGQVTSAEWAQNRLCGERLGFLDIGQIACITIKEWY